MKFIINSPYVIYDKINEGKKITIVLIRLTGSASGYESRRSTRSIPSIPSLSVCRLYREKV